MQIHVLQITCSVGDREEVLHPVLLTEKEEMVLIDCGYPGTLPLLRESAALQGVNLEMLTGLLLTHHDIDHTGASFELLQAYPHVKVYASAGEAPYISGKQKSLRLQQAEDFYPTLPDAYKPGALIFQEALRALKTVEVDVVLKENDRPMGDELQVISTPGHTPGHVSLYLKNEQVLIAADAVVVEDNALEIANPQFTLDLPEAIASVKKLSRLPVRRLICYHGGVVHTGIEKMFTQLLEKYEQAVPA